MTQAEVRRFDFFSLRDFSANPEAEAAHAALAKPEAEIAPPPPPPPPTFSESELEAARRKADEEGFARGVQEGMMRANKADAEREQALTASLRICCDRLDSFRNEYAHHVTQQQDTLQRLALAVANRVAGNALATAPESVVIQMVGECLPLLLGEPRVNITVHSSIISLLKERLEQVGRQTGYDGTLMLEADDSLAPSDCHIQWQGGSAHSSLEETWRAIEEKLRHYC